VQSLSTLPDAPCGPINSEEIDVDYGAFKLLQALLFFGSAMGFCLWQLAAIRRLRRERESAMQRDAHS